MRMMFTRKTTPALLFTLATSLWLGWSCTPEEAELAAVAQWTSYEITLKARGSYANPYTDVAVWAIFENGSDTLVRPAFWDGGDTWRLRFAPPDSTGVWTWRSQASDPSDTGLHGRSGQLQAVPYRGNNRLLHHGLLEMSPGKRSVVHKDGTSFLMVGDTPWAIPFRATRQQVATYAHDRQQKGFNTALLMSLQPDMRAEGPDARNTPQGFARAFDDLQDGHIQQLNPSYFQYLDSLIALLIDHEIVPVYQPVFHGFGWKGLDVLGNTIDPEEYVRYCRYLLARYGSQPAFWLLAGDNGGRDPGVPEAGAMMEQWDAYHQPTGLHYNPCDDYIADWALDNPLKHCMHYNQSFQEAPWLDFQWAQTGHSGEHLYHKVARMYDNQPVKASANGEPTYEGMNDGQNGLGWWQGEEAWMQLMSGGTMGVVYGAAGIWQWKVSRDEAGWTAWASQEKSWQEALDMEGSRYVGLVGKILQGLDLADIEKRWDLSGGETPLLAHPGRLYLAYLPQGGEIAIKGLPQGLPFRWVNPQSGEVAAEGNTQTDTLEAPNDLQPWVLIAGS